jgi:hypothetical protein
VTTKLVLENLKHKPMRSLLSFLLIGVPVTLILTLVGLSTACCTTFASGAPAAVGADILVRASSTTTAVAASADSVKEKLPALLPDEGSARQAGHGRDQPSPSTFRCSSPASTRTSSIP